MTDAATQHAVYLSAVEPERLRWLSRGRLAAGKLTILDGDPGLGKSTLLADWAARVSRGQPLPDGDACPPRGVVLLSAEDGVADTIRPRFEAAGADLDRVLVLQAVPDALSSPGIGRLPTIPDDLHRLEEAIADADAALLILDPLMAYLGDHTNAHRDQDVRRALAPVAQLAERTGVAVVLVRHLNKAQNTQALYRGGGSIGIIGAARCGLLVAVDPDDPERRILAPTKSNLARPPVALAFRLVPMPGTDVARVEWLGETGHTAAALLATPDDEARSERDEAKAWLHDALADGPVAAKELRDRARRDAIADRTLDRAKAALGVRATRHGGVGSDGHWQWALPLDAEGAKGAIDVLSTSLPGAGALRSEVASLGAMGVHTSREGDDGIRRCFACGTVLLVGQSVCPVCHPVARATAHEGSRDGASLIGRSHAD